MTKSKQTLRPLCKLVELRENLKYTQRFVATKSKVDPGQYNRIERGLERASAGSAARIAEVFKGAISELEILYPDRYPACSPRKTKNKAA